MLADLNYYGSRLARTTWGELRVRVRQEIAKHWDALFPARRAGFSKGGAISRGQFFFSPAQLEAIVAFQRRRFPEAVEETIVQAERICRHEFDLLGYEGLAYGPEIDWHLDAVSGKSAPRKAWFKIGYLCYAEVGDVKVTWELNRHQHLVTLAKAYCFTGDDRFALELIKQWYSWQANNPYPIGVNWASSLEVAFRCQSWLWVLHLLWNCPLASAQFKADLHHGLMLGGRHIEKYLSTYFSPNTHLLGEGVALFFLGVLCGDSTAANRWRKRGWEIVLSQAERQVQSDGMHFEQSTYYHAYALDLFLHARILAAKNGIPIPSRFDRVLERMLEALSVLGRAGMPPCLGDDDGGRVFDPHRNQVEHLLDPLATGAVLFGRSDFKATKPDLVEETIWLLGSEKAQLFDDLPTSLLQLESAALRSSGLYLMMFPDKPVVRLTIDAGPHGSNGGGHGHADALSVQLSVGDHDVLVDSGTFAYSCSGPERQLFRGTAAHNTMQVDDLDQAEPAGQFPWKCLPEVRVENWTTGGSFDFLVASHNGYARLTDPVIHRRCIFGLKSRFWLLLDIPVGRGAHRVAVSWHLAPNLHWELQQNSALAKTETGSMALLFAGTQHWSPRILESWHSRVYGNRIRSEVLTLCHDGPLPDGLATLLIPFAGSHPAGFLAPLHHDPIANGVLGYRYESSRESHLFFFPSLQGWQWGELATDARFLYFSPSESGQVNVIACGVTYITIVGRPVIECSRLIERVELSSGTAGTSLTCSDDRAIGFLSLENLQDLNWATHAATV